MGPNRSDQNTGLGHNAADELSLITGGRETERLQSGTVNTTDATVTTLDTHSTASDTVTHVTAVVVAKQTTDFSEMASYRITGTFKNDGGVLTQVGTTTVEHSAESDAAWDCVFDTSGTDIRVRVTGVVATNISWHASLNSVVL